MPTKETVDREEDDTAEEEPESLVPSTPERDIILQEWRLLPEVSLPFAHLDASDGSIRPLIVDEMLKIHIQSGHLVKMRLCKGCLTAEGPRRIHRRELGMSTRQHMSCT